MFQLRAIAVACIFIFLSLCNADDVEEDNLFLGIDEFLSKRLFHFYSLVLN